MATKTSRRPKPMTPRAGVTSNPKRRYCGGGKLYCKGGKLGSKKK